MTLNIAALDTKLRAAGIPIVGISNLDDELAHIVVQFDATATLAQQTAAAAIVTAFVDPDLARQQVANEQLAAAKAVVNGTAISALTANQLRLILLIIVAERGWIQSDGTIAIATVNP